MSYVRISGTKSYVLNFQIVTCYWSGNSKLIDNELNRWLKLKKESNLRCSLFFAVF